MILDLSGNLLDGQIPQSLFNLTGLEWLDLSNNHLTGHVPLEFSNLHNLEDLELSGNLLDGPIPRSLANLTRLEWLELSGNLLDGPIPRSLANLTGLKRLFLYNNLLTGHIPVEFSNLQQLEVLELSENHLDGTIPQSLATISSLFYVNLFNNCLTGELPSDIVWNKTKLEDLRFLRELEMEGLALGGPLPQIVEQLILSNNFLSGAIPPELGNISSIGLLDLSNNKLSGEIPRSLGNLSLISEIHLQKNQLNGEIPASLERKTQRRIFRGRDDTFGSSWLVLKSSFPRITYRELVKATGEFDQDRLIGSGSYGRVYKGVLRDGTIVAVKVLRLQTGNSTKSFNRECQVLKRIRHRNLMRIITACSRPDFKALVLPFMANGSLESFLYSGSSELSLIQRVNICSDIAEGIAYLHHHSPVKVIHRDLKPSNVLLNDDMTAVVSDFGIARLVMNAGVGNTTGADDMGCSTANMLRGSIGYIAPEYGFGSDASTRGDVYSFGVLVLEMVTRKRPTDEMFKGGLSLPNWVKSHYTGRVETVIDASLVTAVKNETYEVKRMSEVAIGELVDLGLLCTQESPSSRPTMLDAADDLGRLKRYLSGDTTASVATSLGMSSSTTGEDPGASMSNLD
ncbi:putative leucine-rich repeat receptor-like serine/threonine-protein kinase [Cocos nucifera]|uniref:non-specific serine/threonine protein kinase n=1 Tax=Cocos nucifera TaxID=13894 RepID=A0A8K0IPW0_COCNU|nr:putative leucine-rich repeat receptor-like serine/threonine-protein kinase [Cocos nucifera]